MEALRGLWPVLCLLLTISVAHADYKITVNDTQFKVSKSDFEFFNSLDERANNARTIDWFKRNGIDGHSLKLIPTGPELEKERIKAIRNAKRSIYLATYAFKSDDTGKKITRELCEKAKQGVDVRIIVDNHGGNKYSDSDINYLRDCNAKFMTFNPPGWNIADLPYVMHEKLLIIDGETLLMGGNGISKQYHIFGRDSDKWHDLDIKVEGSSACYYHKRFMETWKDSVKRDKKARKRLLRAGKKNFKTRRDFRQQRRYERRQYDRRYGSKRFKSCRKTRWGNSKTIPLYGNPLFSKKRPLFEAYIEATIRSKKSIRMYAPYFVPHTKFVALLLWAKSKGMKVQVITNSLVSNDEGSEVLSAMSYRIETLVDAGIEVLLWDKTSTMHRKAGVFDDLFAYVGSDNLDERGHDWSSESIIFTNDRNIVQGMNDEFDLDEKLSKRLDHQHLKELQDKPNPLVKWFIKQTLKFF